MEWKIVFEDEEMLVALKPQGMPTQDDKTGDESLLSLLEKHCGKSLGLVHRLDRPVSGLLVFAKTKEAETKFAKQMQDNKLVKKYLAVVCGELPEESGTLTHYLKKNMRTNLSEIVNSSTQGGKKAVLHYRVLAKSTQEETLSLVEIELETGRHHQIRVQLMASNAPIWGDKKYNAKQNIRGKTEMALHAYSLKGIHPKTKKRWKFEDFPQREPFIFLRQI